MLESGSAPRFRFGVFEADAATGELRRNGLRIRVPAQPFQILLLLLNRPGELLTREEICRELWPDGTFVDYDHSVNSAVNRLRDALGDRAGNPRYIETLARRGYRFLAPVEPIVVAPAVPTAAPPVERTSTTQNLDGPASISAQSATLATVPVPPDASSARNIFDRFLASPEDLPPASHPVVQALFIGLQCMYIAFYVGALANLAEIDELLASLSSSKTLFYVILVTAAALIPVRTFLACAALFRAPRLRLRFLQLWPFLLIADVLWALSPLLLLHHVSFGLALACVPFLVYSPFAQRSLILMGAGQQPLQAVSSK